MAKKTAFSHFQTLNFNLFCISRQRCKSAKGSIGICCWSNLNSKGGGDFIGVQKLHQMPKSRRNNADLFCMFFPLSMCDFILFFILIASVNVSMRSLTDYLCVNLTEWWLLLRKERLMKSHQILVSFPNPLAFGSQILALLYLDNSYTCLLVSKCPGELVSYGTNIQQAIVL